MRTSLIYIDEPGSPLDRYIVGVARKYGAFRSDQYKLRLGVTDQEFNIGFMSGYAKWVDNKVQIVVGAGPEIIDRVVSEVVRVMYECQLIDGQKVNAAGLNAYDVFAILMYKLHGAPQASALPDSDAAWRERVVRVSSGARPASAQA